MGDKHLGSKSPMQDKIGALTRDPNRFAPIFVLAPARSYTSVISTMVGQHPDLVGLPELKLFSYRTVGQLEASLPRFWIDRGVAHRSPGLVRAVAEFKIGNQEFESIVSARKWLQTRSHWTGAEVLDDLMEHLHPRTCVEKSPENVETDDALKLLATSYPRARYLHLSRHPIATQRSIETHYNRIQPGSGQRYQPMSGIGAWYTTHRRIIEFTADLREEHWMRVRSEDVLNDMPAQLGAICRWLRIRDDPSAIDAMMHPEKSPFARPGPVGSGIVGGNDPEFLRNPIPHGVEVSNKVFPPPGWVGDRADWSMIAELARYLGYD